CHDTDVRAVRTDLSDTEIEIPPGEHLEGAGACDLNVPGECGLAGVQGIAGGTCGDAQRRVRIVGGDVSSGTHEGEILRADILHVERNVTDVAPGDDPGGFSREERDAGDIAAP